MRRLLVFLLVSAIPLAPAAWAKRRVVTHPKAFALPALDAIAAAAMKDGLPGLTIAVRKGNGTLVRTFGATPQEGVYQIASVSKQFTAAAIVRLATAGRLSVEDKARRWLPELDARFDAITIEHLITHTSGVRDYNAQLTTAYEPKTQQEIVALITSGPPQFTPGSRWQYSNSGYFLLGMIVERVTSQSYAQHLRDTFFIPLDLERTRYCDPAPDGHWIEPNGTLHALPAADMSLVFAAGALCSTANDLLNWSESLASGRAVTPQWYARMTTSVDPTFAPPPGYGYGLILDALDGRRRVWHNGAILGFQSHLAHYPEEQLTIAVLIDTLDLERDRASEVGVAVARALR